MSEKLSDKLNLLMDIKPTPPESPKPEGKVVAWGMPNSAISGSAYPLMMVRLDVPSDDQYGGALWVPLTLASDYEAMRAERDALKQEVDYVTSIHQNCARTLDEVLETRRSVEAQLKGAIELGAEDMQRADSLTRRLAAMQRECEGLRRAMTAAALKLEADGDEWGVAADLRQALATGGSHES